MNEINRYDAQQKSPTFVKYPWQGSGITIEGDATAQQIMHAADLDWLVQGRPLLTPSGGPEIGANMITVPKYKSIVRASDEEVLGVVGAKWEILQNHEIFSFIDEMQEMGAVKYHSAGSFKGGKIIWVQAEYSESEILPNDVHKKFLLFVNAFDGTFSVRIGTTNVRIACQNALVMATREASKNGVSIRHTASMKEKMEQAKVALMRAEMMSEQFDAFQRALTKLTMTQKMWEDFGHQLIPSPEGKSTTRSKKSRDAMLALATMGRGQDIPGVAGTGYAALNAMTEYVNYERTSRGEDTNAKQHGRFHSTMFGSGGKMISSGIDILNGYLVDNNIQL